MKSFKDRKGKSWEIDLNVTAIKRVRDRLKINLLDLDDGKLIDQLASDPIVLVDVIYLICFEQTEKAGVSDEDFGRAMGGDSLDGATSALLDEIVDFFRDPRRRTVLRQLLEKTRQLETKMLERAEKEVNQMNTDDLMAKVLSSSVINSPGSSGSTPAPSP